VTPRTEPQIASREVEIDGEVTVEISVADVVLADLIWSSLPLETEHPGWMLVARPGRSTGHGCVDRLEWDWDADEQRELAQLEDALRDHARARAPRSEMRVRYWERQARDASAAAAAAWGRGRLRAAQTP
jgi:hypothetical protein